MDCLRSFTLNINQTFSVGSADFTVWNTLGTVLPWTFFDGDGGTFSQFNIQGFKNIDVYGVSLVGSVYPSLAPASNQGLVQDWAVEVFLDGNPPLIGGTFGTNSFGLNQGGKIVFLSKYQNEYKLASPVKSVLNIQISSLSASGIQYENSAGIDLVYDVALVVYYKFEGE